MKSYLRHPLYHVLLLRTLGGDSAPGSIVEFMTEIKGSDRLTKHLH